MIDWNKPLRMKDGTKITRVIFEGDDPRQKYPYICKFYRFNSAGEENTFSYSKDGKYKVHKDCAWDLENYEETPAKEIPQRTIDKVIDNIPYIDLLEDKYLLNFLKQHACVRVEFIDVIKNKFGVELERIIQAQGEDDNA